MKSVGIAFTVETLMVVARTKCKVGHYLDFLKDFIAVPCMCLHDHKFIVIKPSGLVKYVVRNTDLTDIMEKGDIVEILHLILGELAHSFRYHLGIGRNSEGMTSCVLILHIDTFRKCGDDLVRQFLLFLCLFLKFLGLLPEVKDDKTCDYGNYKKSSKDFEPEVFIERLFLYYMNCYRIFFFACKSVQNREGKIIASAVQVRVADLFKLGHVADDLVIVETVQFVTYLRVSH